MMKSLTLWTIIVLAIASILGKADKSLAQDIRGQWQARSSTIRTETLDGKKTLRGPFTVNNDTTKITIDDETYVETTRNGRVSYGLSKDGNDYLLQRQDGDISINVRLTNIKKTNKELRFTSITRNAQRKQQTLVSWVYSPLKPRKFVQHPLKDTNWELVEIVSSDGKATRPVTSDVMSLTFRFGGQVLGKAGSNRFSGFYNPGPGLGLSFASLAATRMADAPNSIASLYLKNLESAKEYEIDKGFLILKLAGGAGTMKFRKTTG